MAEQKFEGLQINPTNLNEQEKTEFHKVYRVLSSDLLEFDQFIDKQQRLIDTSRDNMFGLEGTIKLIENHGDAELDEFMSLLKDSYEKTRRYVEQMNEQVEAYYEKHARAKKFFDTFKEGIKLTDEKGNCEVSSDVMFLVEYLNSLGHIMEPEEKEQMQKEMEQ